MTDQITQAIEKIWDESIVSTISRYIEIPCKSPAFDAHWQENGFLEQAIELAANWVREQNIQGLKLNIERLPGRTPLLFLEIPGAIDKTVVLYGHIDKQPEMVGWHEDLGPWKPVLKNNRLYGRGGADDGYAVFSSIAAIKTLQQQNIPHPRCIVLIEACEESGSYDLPFYMEHLQEKIGTPQVVIGLDSGCGNYEQFWSTTSLRGLIAGEFTVEILEEGIHSGASGVVPSSFRLARQLLSRIEDENTGEILLDELKVNIPQERLHEAKQCADILGDLVWTEYPWVGDAKPAQLSGEELIINRTWKPALSITGVDGIPPLEIAGNVLRPKTTFMLSMRIPPLCDPQKAANALKKALEANPPHNAKVHFEIKKTSAGWNAPKTESWLLEEAEKASQKYFNKAAAYWGDGGTIPFMFMLGNKFPEAQFVITGVLGPNSNAHGPNEFLDIPTAKRVTCCVVDLLAAIAKQYT